LFARNALLHKLWSRLLNANRPTNINLLITTGDGGSQIATYSFLSCVISAALQIHTFLITQLRIAIRSLDET